MDEPRATALQISMLGGFRVRAGDREIPEGDWKRRKAASIVKLLALAPDHRLHRDQLMEALWPDLDPDQAANSLYQALHVARRALDPAKSGDDRYLILRDQILRFAPDLDLWLDAVDFEIAAGEARRRRDPEAYLAALALYQGDLLPDDLYEPWTTARREALRANLVTLLEELAALNEAAGQLAEAIDAARRIIAIDPLHEPAHRTLMRLYGRSGQRQQAIRQFEVLRDALDSELGVAPEPDTVRLHEQIRAGEIAAQPPPPATAAPSDRRPRHNLPAPVSSFIGREREKIEVQRLLAGTRLLTLTGPGGCGKTRLALEVAAEVVNQYDRVWLIELASLADPSLVPQAVAAAIGIREQPGQPLSETVLASLKSERALVVLENCEHLIDACARFAESLLQAAPDIVILATSQEPFRIAGETTWLVPSLSLPDVSRQSAVGSRRDEGVTADWILPTADSEAVRLFVDRAGRIAPGFALTDDNAEAVAELCYRLDGIPLAIELAAARVRALSVHQIVERLSDRFQLLSGGSRTALSRQQTLRAALDWSYDLLGQPERALFARLAVFAGGFTLEAVEAVAGGDVVESLLQLVDRSLVVAEERDGITRYRLLETMREYGRMRLAEQGELETLRRAHAAYYAAFALQGDRQIRGPEQRAWLGRLEQEHDNLRAALDWYWAAALAGRPEDGLVLAGTLHWFWHLAGHFSEGTSWLDRLLATRAASRTRGAATALTGAGVLASAVGNYARTETLLEEAIAIWRELDLPAGLALALTWSGWYVLFQGRVETARDRHSEGFALFSQLDDDWGVALALLGLGFDAAEAGQLAEAQTAFERGLGIFRELRDAWGIATTLLQIAHLAYRAGDYAAARGRLPEIMRLDRLLRDQWLEVQAQMLRGEVARAEGDVETAAAATVASLDLAGKIGHRMAIAWSLRDAGFVALAQGDPAAARSHFNESIARFIDADAPLGLVCCLIGMAGVALAEGHADLSARRLGTAQAALARLGLALAPADSRELAWITAATRSALGDESFVAAWEAGRNLPLAIDSR